MKILLKRTKTKQTDIHESQKLTIPQFRIFSFVVINGGQELKLMYVYNMYLYI